jgi:phosphate:Na+ symporter
MNIMTDGLRLFAGDSLRRILARATRNRLNGLGLGTVIGFLVQSSAATVMMVGFINAGLMTLESSVPVMLGANIGTTLSMQLISFKLADYCFVAITLGVLLKTAAPQARLRNAGAALLGFGLLFLGMSTMSNAVAPYREAFLPFFEQMDGSTAGGMIRGILLAAAITGIIQSSGAVIGMTFALIHAGAITGLPEAFPIILGANIGTCITALLGSIGTHIDARRGAISHLVFNLFSTVFAAVSAPLFYKLIPLLPGGLIHQAANANTIKMIVTAFIVLPFAPLHAAIIRRIIPSRQEAPPSSFLDEELFAKPEQAIHAAMRELHRMAEICRENLQLGRTQLTTPKKRAIRTVYKNENTIDAVKLAFRDYLTRITSRYLSQRQAVLVQHLDLCMTEIERIGDHLKVLCNLNRKLYPYTEHKIFKTCRSRLEELYDQTGTMIDNLSTSLKPEHENYDEFAERILNARKKYIHKSIDLKRLITQHVGREELPPLLGIYLNETVMTLDKIARHCKAVAGAQQKPFFWLKQSKLDQKADEYIEEKILDELDAGDDLVT